MGWDSGPEEPSLIRMGFWPRIILSDQDGILAQDNIPRVQLSILRGWWQSEQGRDRFSLVDVTASPSSEIQE
ncbi:hypothetical protein DV515_00015749, partial [Chloebia gouldiae]